jgi:dTMP kinase
MRGRFIVLEGIDGSGKTTQAKRLVRALRKGVLSVREPGATAVGERIRRLLLDRRSRMSVECELYLYMAARAQLVSEKIRPALKAGRTVVCDRFIYSSAAYQGAAGGLGIRPVLELGRLAVEGATPDKVVIIDLDPAEALKRQRGKADRIERRGLAYQRKVRRGFLKVARILGRRALVIDGARDPDTIHEEIRRRLRI